MARGGRMMLAAMAVALLLAGGGASPAGAIPRYAARYAQNCSLCHVNPTGGGLRGLYASQYLVPAELAMASPKDDRAAPDPRLGENVTIGADLRTLWLAARHAPAEHGFFQMQSSIYLGFQLDPRWSAVVNVAQNGTVEAFGLGWVLPGAGYVKAGRFAPPFGLQLEDHTAFVREELGLAPPRRTDTGLELGFHPGRWMLTAAFLNGASGSARDTDRAYAFVGRAIGRLRLGPAQVAAGGSVLRNEEHEGTRTMGGPLAMVAVGPLTWLGEFDWSRLARDHAHAGEEPEAPGDPTAFVMSQELTCQLRQGLDLRLTQGFVDPDLDRLGGAQSRYGAGLEARPYPFLGLQAMLNLYRRDAGPDRPGRHDAQTAVLLHLFY